MKDLNQFFKGQKTYIRPQNEEDQKHKTHRDKLIFETAKLIDLSFIATKMLVKDWPEWKIEQRYKEAMNCSEKTKPAIRWWSLRKMEKNVTQP